MDDRDFRPWKSPANRRPTSSFKKIGSTVKRILGLKRKLEPWELKAMAAAEAKRARRRERNITWWTNDKTWEFYGSLGSC
jgi:hypothetical protein